MYITIKLQTLTFLALILNNVKIKATIYLKKAKINIIT